MRLGGWKRAAVLALTLAVVGCDILGDIVSDSKKPLKGERISVLTLDRRLEPDPALSAIRVSLPRPAVNADWPQAGGDPSHAMQHLALDGPVKEVWSADIGEGQSRYGAVLSQPVIAGGRLFALDARDAVTALDAKTGHELWRNDVKPDDELAHTYGGGLAVEGDRLYVTTGYGQVLALEAASGKEIWRQQVSAPMRGAPTVADGRVFAVTVENELDVLSAEDGHRLWTHDAIPETAGLLGAASPAVEGDVVVVPFTSGEIVGLLTENGRQLWADNLAVARPLGALSTLSDIRGRPVIDRDRVFAVGHAGRMVAIDLRTGDRVWEQDIGGTHGPWVAGDYIYVLSNDVDLLCLTREDGRVRWSRELPRYEDMKRKEDPLRWAGPVLAGDRLIVIASDGVAVSISPYTGKPLGRVGFPSGVSLDPIVANDMLFVLTNDADVIALK
ncbi:MAG TPA: PQQ-binding-like beta-propeller repeat protein [Stellaceae bacterium]|nr:PQQ-binding-like beta-propeller repeat protein [Stellaceae bacterium]